MTGVLGTESHVVTELLRLTDAREKGVPWRQWGPYLSERQWGTVREDYSDNGDAWNHFSHDQARSRAYHWGEDGLAGRNHGEDAKDYYFYLDSTPTDSYLKCLYKYPQTEFPYLELIETNRRRSRQDSEYELLDTGYSMKTAILTCSSNTPRSRLQTY